MSAICANTILIVGPIGGTINSINAIYASLKRTFSGLLRFFCRQHGYILIRVAIVASQICEITQNSPKI